MNSQAAPKKARQLCAAAKGLDHNILCGAIAQRHARATELADQHVLAGDFLDDGRFAKAHLTQPLAQIRPPIQLGDTPRHAGGKLGKSQSLVMTFLGGKRHI
jgi:hypothetical protein